MNYYLGYDPKSQKYWITSPTSFKRSDRTDTIFKAILNISKNPTEAERITKIIDEHTWYLSKEMGIIWKLPDDVYQGLSDLIRARSFEEALSLYKLHC